MSTAAKKKSVRDIVPKVGRVPQETPDPATNRYKRWHDWQLEEVLRCVPTKENAEAWARIFERRPGAISLIYRWAYTKDADIQALLDKGDNRGNFALRVRSIAKNLGILI